MADRQMAGITGNATMRVPITGNVNVGGSAIRELRFMPRSAFPEVGRSDVLYIDTLGECIYYWNGGEYVQLSGGGSGTDNYNSLQNRPKINNVTLEGEQTSSDLGLQSSIDDLSSIRSGASAGATALQPEDVDTLPTDGSSNPVSSGGTYDFVNSSIATNTAYFIGTFASVAELEAYTGTVTNNDYAFVTSTDSAGNTLYNRYKYNAATQTWSFEYAVNNTAFTTAQWAAIQSGMTSADKTKLDGIETGANKTVIDASPTSGSSNAVSSGGVHTALSGKQDTIADLSDIRSGASAGATAVQPSALNDYQTKLSGTNKLDPSYIDYDASHRAVSDTEKSTWNGKQDAISDLDTIRSGAAAGATALQQSDVTSIYSASGTAPVNGTAVNAAIETLDVSSVGGSGKYISAISEENGKIAATPITFDTALSSSSTNNNAPTSKTVYDDQQRQEVEIGAVANAGAKNLFDVRKATFGDTSKISISVDDTVTSTATSDPRQWVWANREFEFTLPAGTYVFKYSVVSGTVSSALRFRLMAQTDDLFAVLSNTKDSVTFTLTSNTTLGFMGKPYELSFKLQIQNAAITDPTFQPYALPNPTLTPAAIKAVDDGAKNLCNWSASTSTIEHVTFTINSDKTVSTSGTATARAQKALTFTVSSALKAGRYALSGCPSGGIQSGTILYCLYIWDNTASTRVCSNDTGGGIEFDWTPDASHTYTITIDVRSGTNASGLTFKPMICTAQDWAVSQKFVQYCPTNRELYETKATMDDVYGYGKVIASNSNLNNYTLPGSYYCPNATVAGSLTNTPISDAGFRLVVELLTNTDARFMQTIHANGNDGAFYQRKQTSQGMSSWYKFEGTVVT